MGQSPSPSLVQGVPPDFGYGIGSRDGIASAAFAKGVPESAGSRLLWGMSPVHSAAVFDEEGAMLRFLKEGVPLETLLQVAVTGSARKCVSALLREGLGVAVGDCSWEELRETAGRLVKEWGKDRITAMGDLEVAEMEMTPEVPVLQLVLMRGMSLARVVALLWRALRIQCVSLSPLLQDIAFFGKAPEDTSVRRKKHIEQLVQWAFGNTDGDTLAGGSVGG